MQYFSDLDDTITSNKCLFYSKIKIYKKLNNYEKNKYKYFKEIIDSFEINKKFLAIIKMKNISSVFILSRNDEYFIKFFIKYFNDNFSNKYNFKIIGGEGNIGTIDKMKYIDGRGTLISDIFEYKTLKGFKNFICIDKYNILTKYYIIAYKVIYLMGFTVSFILKKSIGF